MASKKNKKICIIPLRSGSQSVKDKNIVEINLIPLCIYVIRTAISSNLFGKIIIATDSMNYIRIIKKFVKKSSLIFFRRSRKSSTHFSRTEVVIGEVLKLYPNYEVCYLMQATSPLTIKEDLKKAKINFEKYNFDSLFSCYESKKFFWRKIKNYSAKVLNYNFFKRPMRQKFEANLVENGAFYVFNTKKFLKFQNRLFGKIGYYIMPEKRSLDIDNIEDIKNLRTKFK